MYYRYTNPALSERLNMSSRSDSFVDPVNFNTNTLRAEARRFLQIVRGDPDSESKGPWVLLNSEAS